MESTELTQRNIYKLSRTIKQRDNNLYNALKSIYDDSIFVSEIAQLWPQLPLLANLRCGLWYSSKFHATCYFKSTDGHNNNWSFNTSRLNLHVALLVGQKGGCFIVDSTRKGKRFPDSMSKTIPIWTCVLNRSIRNYRNRMSQDDCVLKEEVSSDWDCSLHLPLWVFNTERASIETRLEEWTKQLDSCGADIASLSLCLKKPLRPLWISQRSVIWLNEIPDHDSWDFTPIILLNASSPNGVVLQPRTTSEFSWNYIPGAGDDEESWSRGLTPSLFWKHAVDLINSGPEFCNQKVAEIVEKDRVYHAQRGKSAPQVTIKPLKSLLERSVQVSCMAQQLLSSDVSDLSIEMKSTGEDPGISWLGSTNVAVGTSEFAASVSDVDCILNCDKEPLSICHSSSEDYMHLPIVDSKFDRFSLLNNLSTAVGFARSNFIKGKKLLVCCRNGEDISVCVCLAILISLFNDEEGNFDDGKSFNETRITKWEMRRRLVFVCKFATSARPSRGNLKQVFNFLSDGVGKPLLEDVLKQTA
ncbi:hypothetical protein ACFE04_015299 [Oxalis oulophora]